MKIGTLFKGLKPWTKILLVVNVGSLEKRSRTRSPKTTAKLI